MSVEPANLSSPAAPAVRSPYIVGPAYDWLGFILAPLLAVVAAWLCSFQPYAMPTGVNAIKPGSTAFILIFTHAHLVIVVFRSHADREIFRLHRLRFTLVPLALFGLMVWSTWALVAVTVLATWWDVYHSGLQTFGLGRIYDARAGNPPEVGRRLDVLLNHLLYLGPILGGASLMSHVDDFYEFRRVNSAFFTSIPAYASDHARLLTWAVLAVGVPFLGYYVFAYWRLAQQGYRVSTQKVVLYALTGLVSLTAWGFNSFGMAFFIMNFFHAWQYFALVWWKEERNITRVFGLGLWAPGRVDAFLLFLAFGFGYGYLAYSVPTDNDALLALTLTVSIMHFWYDGFVWSVRRRQV